MNEASVHLFSAIPQKVLKSDSHPIRLLRLHLDIRRTRMGHQDYLYSLDP